LQKTGICVDAPVSINDAPYGCISNLECKAVSEQAEYSGWCKCGINADKRQYCEPFPGDDPGVDYLNAAKSFVNSGALELCNTARRFESACWELSVNTTRYEKLIQTYDYFSNYPKYVDNPICV
jgi:hypothetical protein